MDADLLMFASKYLNIMERFILFFLFQALQKTAFANLRPSFRSSILTLMDVFNKR